MNNELIFKVEEAAYLVIASNSIDFIDIKDNLPIFSFHKTGKLEQDIEKYHQGKAVIEPRVYFQTCNNLKVRVYDMMFEFKQS